MKIEFLKDYKGKYTKDLQFKKGDVVECRINASVFGDVLVEQGVACLYGSKPEEVIVEEKVIVIEEPKVVKKKAAKKAPKKVSK